MSKQLSLLAGAREAVNRARREESDARRAEAAAARKLARAEAAARVAAERTARAVERQELVRVRAHTRRPPRRRRSR